MQEPFPHVLTFPEKRNKFLIRFVTDDKPGEMIYEPDRFGGFNAYVVDKISHERKAKGDWTNWKTHPTYYEGVGRYIGKRSKPQ
jgi:hypothetical protein